MEICLYCIFNPAQSVNCMLGWMQSGTFNHARNLSVSFSSTSLPYKTITGTRRSVSYMSWCCSDLWPRWIKLCIICEFSSSWTQPCGGNGISRSGEMICKKVVYIALKWPVPRRELPYVAIWKSWEMMPSDIKASVCAFVRCVVVLMCLWQCKARVTYLPDIRHTLWVCVLSNCPSFYLFLAVCLHDRLPFIRKTVALCVCVCVWHQPVSRHAS